MYISGIGYANFGYSVPQGEMHTSTKSKQNTDFDKILSRHISDINNKSENTEENR